MHPDMAGPHTDNPDTDFINGMIRHHQGAVEMAKIIPEHGRDPEVKAFGQKIIDAREAAITRLRDWLA